MSVGSGSWLSQLAGQSLEGTGSQYADHAKNNLSMSMNVCVHLDTYAKMAGSFLSPPYHQECSSAAIEHTCLSNPKECSRGQAKQHFQELSR